MPSNKEKGYAGEQVASRYLENQGWQIIAENFTIAGGEIDLIAETSEERVFVEVKVVSKDTELAGYITQRQIAALRRTAGSYNLRFPTHKTLRLDAIFVSDKSIREHFEYINFYQ